MILATASLAQPFGRIPKPVLFGAAILRNSRRVRILLASHHPLRETFLTAARALAP